MDEPLSVSVSINVTTPTPRGLAEQDARDKLELCEQRIGHVFRDKMLLFAALTHASGAGHRLASNERLEFLGDAILGTIVCELLFHQFPEYLEGDLTRIKSVVVSRTTCAKIGETLRLQDCLFVGKGVLTNPVVPPSLLADAFESLVAAVYLDGGMEAACRFVTGHIAPEVTLAATEDFSGNYKSYLQQYSQREFGVTPTYQLVDEQGPDHSKCFQVAAVIGAKSFEPAWGRNKKEAEQRAACNALTELNAESPPPDVELK
jgi:ribonuclease-3